MLELNIWFHICGTQTRVNLPSPAPRHGTVAMSGNAFSCHSWGEAVAVLSGGWGWCWPPTTCGMASSQDCLAHHDNRADFEKLLCDFQSPRTSLFAHLILITPLGWKPGRCPLSSPECLLMTNRQETDAHSQAEKTESRGNQANGPRRQDGVVVKSRLGICWLPTRLHCQHVLKKCVKNLPFSSRCERHKVRKS